MANIAIIPARGGSKRFPRKNIALLKGKPLLYYAIAQARESGVFDRIIVSTEDAEISIIAQKHGAEVFGRSEGLAADDATVPMVCLDVIRQLEKSDTDVVIDTICILLPTSPLRVAGDIRKAFEKFRYSGADYLMSVTDYRYSPFRAMISDEEGFLSSFFGAKYLTQDQKNPHVCVHDGSIICINVSQFRQDRTYYGRRLIGYYIPPERTVDINEPFDLMLAEFLMDHKGCQQQT